MLLDGVAIGSLIVVQADIGGVTQDEAGIDDRLNVMVEVEGWLMLDDGIETLSEIKKLSQVKLLDLC